MVLSDGQNPISSTMASSAVIRSFAGHGRAGAGRRLRCEVSVIREGDPTGENAIECGAIALACVNCGGSAGCEEHELSCPKCGKPVCTSANRKEWPLAE